VRGAPAAGEARQVAHDRARPGRLLPDDRECLQVARRALVGEHVVGEVEDRRQRVVELVRDAAHELAQRGELLRLAERLLGRAERREIGDEALEVLDFPVGVAHDLRPQAHGDRRPVLAQPLDFRRLARARGAVAPDQPLAVRGVAVHLAREVRALELLRGVVAQHRDERRVHVQQLAVDRGPVDPVRRALDVRAEARLGAAHGELGGDALGHVAKAPDAPHHLAVHQPLRAREALEDAPVLEVDDVEALRLGVRVEVGDPAQEVLGVGDLPERVDDRAVVVPRRLDIVGNLPHVDEPAVVARYPSGAVHHQDAIGGGLERRAQQRHRPLQLGGGRQALGDVADRQRVVGAPADLGAGERPVERELLAAAAQPDARPMGAEANDRPPRLGEGAVVARLLLAVALGDEVGDRPADGVLRRRGEDLLGRAVHEGDAELLVHHDDRVERRLDDGREARLGLGELAYPDGAPRAELHQPGDEHHQEREQHRAGLVPAAGGHSRQVAQRSGDARIAQDVEDDDDGRDGQRHPSKHQNTARARRSHRGVASVVARHTSQTIGADISFLESGTT
jgi:hypothetical protein